MVQSQFKILPNAMLLCETRKRSPKFTKTTAIALAVVIFFQKKMEHFHMTTSYNLRAPFPGGSAHSAPMVNLSNLWTWKLTAAFRDDSFVSTLLDFLDEELKPQRGKTFHFYYDFNPEGTFQCCFVTKMPPPELYSHIKHFETKSGHKTLLLKMIRVIG